MDVSARLITLAVNIAVMGLVLVAGILSALDTALGPAPEAARLRAVAEQLAGGDVVGARGALAALDATAAKDAVLHTAVTRGFGWVLLYGALGALLTAAFSLAVLTSRPEPSPGLQLAPRDPQPPPR